MKPGQFVDALCNMLLQSLWFGVFLAVAAALIILGTRTATARLRHNMLVAALFVFAGALLISFIRPLLVISVHPDTAAAPIRFTIPNAYQATYKWRPTAFLQQHSQSIVMVWMLIVVLKTLQLLTGLKGVYILRRKQLSPAGDVLEGRLKALARQLGINRMVRIATSGMAKVPMVIGHLKPLILIPAGLLTALPPAAIEAIILHELAHIKRRDYLINLLVSSLEVVLFFNPAVLWIGALIRAEREHCCDDIVVAHTGSKKIYIEALVACEEYQAPATACAMALNGGKQHLLGRVKRIMYNSNASLSMTERAVLALTLLTTVLGTAAFTNADKISKLVSKTIHPAKNVAAHHAIKVPKVVPATKLAINAKHIVQHTDTDTVKTPKMFRTALFADSVKPIINTAMPVAPAAHSTPITPIRTKVGALFPPSPTSGQKQLYANPAYEPYKQPYKPFDDKAALTKLIPDLVSDGIIQNADDLRSFKLSNTEFIVNSKRMPDAIYQKYRKDFVPVPLDDKPHDWAWLHNFDDKDPVTDASL